MGWLKGRQVLTASAVFNLSGKLADRPNFRKSTVVGAVLNGAESIGESMTKAYLTGPGIKLKQFHNWALANYQAIGVPGSVKLTLKSALPGHIRPQVEMIHPGTQVSILGIQMGVADPGFWAEQKILRDFPDRINTLWSAFIDRDTNLITITFADATTHQFMPANFVQGAMYIFASYAYKDITGFFRNGMYIYRIGSGNPTLDALYEEESQPSEAFLAPIPVRLEGKFISKTNRPAMYRLANKAAKKAFSVPLDDVIEQLAESESIDDMDYVYLAFGAPANTREAAAREYIFTFLEDLAAEEAANAGQYSAWKTTAGSVADTFDQWKSIYEEAPPEDGQPQPDPVTPVNPQPAPPDGPPSRPWRGIKIENPGGGTNYDVRLTWNALTIETGTGLAKPDAVVGEYWFSVKSPDVIQTNPYLPDIPTDLTEIEVVWMYHQISASEWKAIQIVGMVQQTYVFGNNYEELTLASQIDQFEDDPERESPFLFPIRYSVLNSMSLKDATQFATSCAFVQVHSYEIHIQRIYQTPLFSLLMVAVVIAITAASGGLGGASVGILGTNAAVGAALGAVGALATVVGAVANAVAAMVLTAIITKVSTEIFGAKIGAIIGTVVSMVAINGLTNLADTGTFALNFGNLSTAQSILAATSAVSNAATAYIKADIQQIARESEEFMDSYTKQLNEVAERYAELIGYDIGSIDPLSFLEMNQQVVESSSEFLRRTLLTGSDIAELTMLMLSNFTQITLNLDGPK